MFRSGQNSFHKSFVRIEHYQCRIFLLNGQRSSRRSLQKSWAVGKRYSFSCTLGLVFLNQCFDFRKILPSNIYQVTQSNLSSSRDKYGAGSGKVHLANRLPGMFIVHPMARQGVGLFCGPDLNRTVIVFNFESRTQWPFELHFLANGYQIS
ncbi:hypothetical protein BYT27DRAFT_6405798 [Phlegmacium glaucopus]|nr:hypothetical protein BYT27DRAFT_6405798 [Phlegmacium glaucopus]